jgi:Tol biopolymer transport system component
MLTLRVRTVAGLCMSPHGKHDQGRHPFGKGRLRRSASGVYLRSFLILTIIASTLVAGSQTALGAPARGTTRVSQTSLGEQLNAASFHPSISDDGRYVMFGTYASNLPGASDSGGWREHSYVVDRSTGSVQQVDVCSWACPNHSGFAYGLSGNGRFAVFYVPFLDIVPDGDTRQGGSYIRDMLSGTTSKIDGHAWSVSDNGQVLGVSWETHTLPQGIDPNDPGLTGLGVIDRTTGSIQPIRTPTTTVNKWKTNPKYGSPWISGDGSTVFFRSVDGNLVPGDPKAWQWNVYAYTRSTGITSPVSLDPGGNLIGGIDSVGSVSDDGARVVFVDGTQRLWLRDRSANTTTLLATNVNAYSRPHISGDGQFVVFQNLHGWKDIMGINLLTMTEELISSDSLGNPGNNHSWDSFSTDDGSETVFSSDASNLVPADTNGRGDIFVKGRLVVSPDPFPGGMEDIRSYVALGDSYSAGEGVEPYYIDPNTNWANECHRSYAAFPTFVHGPDSQRPIAYREAAGETAVRFDFAACTGATTDNVRSGGPSQHGEPAQLDQGFLDANTDLVTITIGGDDAGFASVLQACWWHGCTDSEYRPFGDPPRAFTEWLPDKIDGLASDLEETFAQIRDAAPEAIITVLGYPRLFPDTVEEQDCIRLKRYSSSEQNFLNEMAVHLNSVIAQAALAEGIAFVDVADHFWNHEVCADGGEWINGVYLAWDLDLVEDRTFHPNEVGQREYATPLNESLAGSSGSAMNMGAESPATMTPPEILDSYGDLRLIPIGGEPGDGCPGDDPLQVRALGAGFAPDGKVSLELGAADVDNALESWTLTADENGTIDHVFSVSGSNGSPDGAKAFGPRAGGGDLLLIGLLPHGSQCGEFAPPLGP